jgi:hypothetical protein
MYMRFGTWDIRCLYRTGSLKTAAGELRKCKLDLVGVEEVRWEKGGTERAGSYTRFFVERNEDHHLETVFVRTEENISG